MPRIEPYQLLKCLSVLLSPSGGIKSKDEVQRLASLMTKFSKKLVSKCIYVLILKATDINLLDMFMSAGGWDLTYSWLNDGIQAKNWALVGELVELLLLCPVDIERLKGNNCPKLIKQLSKDPLATTNVRELACKVVEQWLAIVKGACEFVPPQSCLEEPTEQEGEENGGLSVEETDGGNQLPVYKITIRDGKQVLAEVISGGGSERVEQRGEKASVTVTSAEDSSSSSQDTTRGKEEQETSRDGESADEDSDEDVVKPVQLGRRRGAAKKREPPRKRGTERKQADPDFRLADKKKEKKSSKSPEAAKKTSFSRDKHKSKDRAKPSQSQSQEESQNEKDRATLAKLVGPPIATLGKIPRKSSKEDSTRHDDKKQERKPADPPKPPPKDPKKYNISVEPRKSSTSDRPKTVKTYNSKFRSTGLEEAPPPPKSKKPGEEERKAQKRSSPCKEAHPVPEKKVKEEKSSGNHHSSSPPPQPPKPKTNFLQESDVFADALTAANPIKDNKKKKRRTSVSETKKESGKVEEKKSSEPIKPALKFYQDTLVTSEDKNNGDASETIEIKEDSKVKSEAREDSGDHDELEDLCPSSPMTKEELEDEVAKAEEAITQVLKQEEKKNVEREKNRLPRGILAYIKKKRIVKKSVQWKPDSELETTKYFELDETERVNVTKPFTDMKQMERINEREHMLMSRKSVVDDVMEEKTYWRSLVIVDVPGEQIIPGKNSLEKDIQFARERTILQALYFNRRTIPDSPGEPDLEIHATTDPGIIPLDDQTGNSESVISYRNKPWPEPKGYPPGNGATSPAVLLEGGEVSPQTNFLPAPVIPPNYYPPAPPFPAQPMAPPPQPMPAPQPHPDWSMGGGTENGGGGMVGGGDMMMGGPMMGPEMYGMGPPPEFMGPPPPPHFMGPPMFPPFPPQAPPGPRPPWFRQNGPGTWRHPSKGGGNWNKTRGLCNNYLKKGSCRVKQCPYRHPAPR